MSIIYKALQKTQKHREQQNSLPIPHTARLGFWVDIGLLLVIAILLILVSINYRPKMPHFFTAAKPVEKPVAAPAPVPVPVTALNANEANFKAKFVLNGVFTTDQTKIAVINNQYYRLGDILDGMKIVAIGDANVEFQNQVQTITIRVPI